MFTRIYTGAARLHGLLTLAGLIMLELDAVALKDPVFVAGLAVAGIGIACGVAVIVEVLVKLFDRP